MGSGFDVEILKGGIDQLETTSYCCILRSPPLSLADKLSGTLLKFDLLFLVVRAGEKLAF